MADEIIVIDKIEEAEDNKGKTYLKITDKAGVTRNFKEGRSNLLTNKGHLLKEGVAINLHFQDYKAPSGQIFPFVRDFELVKDVFVDEAAEKVQRQTKDSREGSIEAQVGQKGGIEILKVLIKQALLTDKEIQRCKEYAMSSVEWGMGRVNLPAVIVGKIEEAKSEKTTNNDDKTTDRQQGKERTSGPPGGEALELQPEEVTNAGELFTWIMKMDPSIKAPRLWVQTNFKLSDKEIITDEKAQALKKTIQAKMKW